MTCRCGARPRGLETRKQRASGPLPRMLWMLRLFGGAPSSGRGHRKELCDAAWPMLGPWVLPPLSSRGSGTIGGVIRWQWPLCDVHSLSPTLRPCPLRVHRTGVAAFFVTGDLESRMSQRMLKFGLVESRMFSEFQGEWRMQFNSRSRKVRMPQQVGVHPRNRRTSPSGSGDLVKWASERSKCTVAGSASPGQGYVAPPPLACEARDAVSGLFLLECGLVEVLAVSSIAPKPIEPCQAHPTIRGAWVDRKKMDASNNLGARYVSYVAALPPVSGVGEPRGPVGVVLF